MSTIDRTTTMTQYVVDYATSNFPIQKIVYTPQTNYVTTTVEVTKTKYAPRQVFVPQRTGVSVTAISTVAAESTFQLTDYNVITSTTFNIQSVVVTAEPTHITQVKNVVSTISTRYIFVQPRTIFQTVVNTLACAAHTVTTTLRATDPYCAGK